MRKLASMLLVSIIATFACAADRTRLTDEKMGLAAPQFKLEYEKKEKSPYEGLSPEAQQKKIQSDSALTILDKGYIKDKPNLIEEVVRETTGLTPKNAAQPQDYKSNSHSLRNQSGITWADLIEMGEKWHIETLRPPLPPQD